MLLSLFAFFAIGKGQDCALIDEVASRRVSVNDDKLSFDGTLLPTGFYTGCSEICYEIRVVFLSDEVMYDQLRFRVDMYDFDTGIELQSAAQSEVVANAVLLHQGGNALKMSYSPESRIDHNSFHALLAVSATSAMDVRLSPKSTLSCNCTDGTAYGFFSFDDNHDLMLRGNSFGQHVVGRQLGLDLPGMPLVSVIGPQPHAGNTWAFPDMLGGVNVATTQDKVIKSQFTVHTPQGTIYHPLVETPNCGGCEQDWFVQEEGTPFTCAEPCAAVPESPEAMPEGVSAVDREIAASAWSLPNHPNYRLGSPWPVCDSTILLTATPEVVPAPAALRLWPNPAGHTLQVEAPQAPPGLLHAVLYDARGREVRRLRLPSGQSEWQLSLEGLPPGLYLLALRSVRGELVAQGRFVVGK